MTPSTPVHWIVRPATEADEPSIRALVRSEKLNPIGLRWPTFVVAANGNDIIGAAQIRRHLDGSRELSSVVVAAPHRGLGVAAALIQALLSREAGRLHVITSSRRAAMYARFGFRRQSAWAIPPAVHLNLLMGRLAGLLCRLRGQPATPLGVLALSRPTQMQAVPSRQNRNAS